MKRSIMEGIASAMEKVNQGCHSLFNHDIGSSTFRDQMEPFGREVFHEIGDTWSHRLNELHCSFIEGRSDVQFYLRSVLDSVTRWGDQLNQAVRDGRMHKIYLAVWLRDAKGFDGRFESLKSRLRKTLREETRGGKPILH